MLYIKSLSDSTVQFGDGGEHTQTYSKDLIATSDELDRIWIQSKYKHEKVLNSCLVSEISFWDGDEYIIYPDAEQFVINFNLEMNNQALVPVVEVTTTTTTT